MGVRTKNILSAPVVAIDDLVISWQSGSARLQWNAIPGAHTYEVYRADNTDGPFTLLAETSQLTFDDTNLLPGSLAFYHVRARGGI